MPASVFLRGLCPLHKVEHFEQNLNTVFERRGSDFFTLPNAFFANMGVPVTLGWCQGPLSSQLRGSRGTTYKQGERAVGLTTEGCVRACVCAHVLCVLVCARVCCVCARACRFSRVHTCMCVRAHTALRDDGHVSSIGGGHPEP